MLLLLSKSTALFFYVIAFFLGSFFFQQIYINRDRRSSFVCRLAAPLVQYCMAAVFVSFLVRVSFFLSVGLCVLLLLYIYIYIFCAFRAPSSVIITALTGYLNAASMLTSGRAMQMIAPNGEQQFEKAWWERKTEDVRSRRTREGDGNNGKHHSRRQQTIVAAVAGKTATPELAYRATPENVKRHNVLPIVLRDGRRPTNWLLRSIT